ncbi:MAG: sodium-dependent transporter [Victivallaceae bacterium]|nr:sodium-dependent transporter [Victivallaceae bacterium]
MPDTPRESLSSRIGFLMLAAGCAVGLGNIWRFPFVAGKYGGASFILLYLAFLALMGFPLLVMELAIGRGAQRNLVGAMRKLSPHGFWWRASIPAFAGNVILMMFYTTVTGWMLAYTLYYVTGELGISPMTADEVGGFFGDFVSSPWRLTEYMLVTVALGTAVGMLGLRRGVERITKILMSALFILLVLLVGHSMTLSGAAEGVRFFFYPRAVPAAELGEMVAAAMGQAFFTLSLGVGSMTVFGSYIGKEHTLAGESLRIIGLDTTVALLSGLVIFPACFSFGIDAGSGPTLIFVTLPNIFAQMWGGRWWGMAFFLFMSAAAMTTVIAVFENIVTLMIDEFKFKRHLAVLLNGLMIAVLSLPCALGFNRLAAFRPFGEGSCVLDLEDFMVSDLILPSGALLIMLFCVMRGGWGWKNFIAEANSGTGCRFPNALRQYVTLAVPPAIILILAIGIYRRFFA